MIAKSTKRRMVAEKSNKENSNRRKTATGGNSNRRKPVMAVAESAYMIQDFSYGSCLGCIINLSCLCSLSGLNSPSSPQQPPAALAAPAASVAPAASFPLSHPQPGKKSRGASALRLKLLSHKTAATYSPTCAVPSA